jgi:phage terminase large subunit-like protein
LEPWQEKIVRDIFGTLNEDGTRQYRTVYIEIPRKNGKSELAAAIALYLLFGDREPGAEIYSAAGDRDQASIVFDVGRAMVEQEPELEELCKMIPSLKRIEVGSMNSVYRVLSADHATKHGFNAHGVIFDELHTQPNRHLWDVLTTSGGTREQPLTVAITTAGYDRNSICWEQHEYARKVIEGVIDDPTFYAVIYAAEKDEDWTDERVWHKANPALGSFRDIREMRSLCEKAKQTPALENTFRRLYLNQWTQQETRWLPMDRWRESSGEVYEQDLLGETAFAGLDLASTTDVAAFVLVFPDGEGSYDVWPRFWVPEERMARRVETDGVPYDVWARDGLVEVTPGDVIDYRYIRKAITDMGQRFYVKEIAYDRWGATEIVQYLQDDGFEVVPFGQGFASFAGPTKELLRLVLERRLRHGGNPVLTWMADNLVVKQDPAGNWRPDKAKSTEKIDGMVALIMGLDRAMRHGGSVYEDRGIITL